MGINEHHVSEGIAQTFQFSIIKYSIGIIYSEVTGEIKYKIPE